MTLIRRTPFGSLDQLFDSFFNDEQHLPHRRFQPAVNVAENDEAYVLSVAAPGMKKDQFKIELDHDVLTISGEVREENQEEGKNYSRREFALASFSRSFNLPEGRVDENKVKAEYQDGVLHVNLPKREEYKPRPSRLIDIK